MAHDVPPRWFRQAVSTRATSHRTQHDGCELAYRSWGEPGNPGVLLVHGGAAHSHWWDFIAPAFADRYHVVALDLSGHGDSARRDVYPLRTWASELLAVIDAAGFTHKPVVVGHSMGGVVSTVARALHGERFEGVVIVDAPVRSVDEQRSRRNRIAAFANPRIYETREAAEKAFRLIPSQPCENAYLVRHIAAHSVREVDGGYSWKFDPGIMKPTVYEPLDEHLSSTRCPAALIVGERSEVVDPDMVDLMSRILGPDAPVVCLRDAHHHVLLDQPLAFIEAVGTQLDRWLPRAG